MSDLFKHRHAKLGCMVLRLFPKVMQTVLKYYFTTQGLKKKYLQTDFRFVFTKNESVLMNMLPNMDEFTIEICYKILRSEKMLDEPKCKGGNCPRDTEIGIADDIQRLIQATNSIIGKKSEEVTAHYAEKLLEEIKLMVTRIDSYLEQDTLESMYNNLCRSETDCISILQDLTSVKMIEESLTNTVSEKRERFSRLSIPIIETFPNILRDVIKKSMSAKLLYQKYAPVLKTFYPEQQEKIKELQHSNSYGSLDVTLIYYLLKRFELIPPPQKGWGRLPDKVDIQLGDDVERIRYYRNELAHRCDSNVDEKKFNEYFDEFRDIGYRMDQIFLKTTNYEQDIIGSRTCGIDTAMEAKYENAMEKIENITLRYEKRPIRVYWGVSFERSLMNLRSMLKDAKLEGRQKVRVQIIFQNEDEVESNIEVLNSLKEEINEGLSGIEFIVATKGSLVLIVNILLEILETEDKLLTVLALFLEKILAHITTVSSETIDIVLLPVEGPIITNQLTTIKADGSSTADNLQWKKPKTMGEQVYFEFDIEAKLLENDDIMVEQLRKISDAILKHSNGSGTNQNITATLLPINFENIRTTEQAIAGAQAAVTNSLPISVKSRQPLNVNMSTKVRIWNCIKIGNKLAFTDIANGQLIFCKLDGSDIYQISLTSKPWYMTGINCNTVAVSCFLERRILIIDITTSSETSNFFTSTSCSAISYGDPNLYVVIERKWLHVMDLTGKVIRNIPLPSDNIQDITVDRDRFVCIDNTTIYCCSLDGKVVWKSENEICQDLCRVTTDDTGNVYVTDWNTNIVVVVSNDGNIYKKIITKSDGLVGPSGIHFDNKENVLLVCNEDDGKAFLFDVEKKLT